MLILTSLFEVKMKKLSELSRIYCLIFNRRAVNNLGKSSGFIKRKRELTGHDFLIALSLGSFKK